MAKDAVATVPQVPRSSPLRVTPNRTSTPRISPLASFLALLSLGSLAALYLSFTSIQPIYPPGSLAVDARGGSAGSCRMTYMSPSYLRLDGFGANQTRLGGGPWGLYLYREAGWDEEPFLDDGTLALTGSPVFFVPGNAGSFRQVRSIASTVARTWWITPGVERSRAGHVEGAGPVDFFTLDFNDDFSAFHGQTLLDQAEYLADAIKFVLGLYGERAGRVKAESVVVVAHSMGGIVARAAFLDPKYRPKSISTILSIATPHIVPPVTVDPSVGTVYDAVTSYWRRGHGLESNDDVSVVQELEDVVLISIGGGVSDVMVASEAVSVKSLLPAKDTHGFTVLTTSIAGVQTPIDHLAILWCQQLVQIIADSLLSIVDTRTPRGVVPRKERIASLGFRLLGEVERGKGVVASASVSLETIEGGVASTRITEGERLVIRERVQERTTYVLHFPPIPISTFLLTASAKIDAGPDGVEVYACHVSDPTRSGCSPLFPSHASDLPLSLRADTSPLIPAAIEEGVMGFVGIDVSQLGGMDSVVVVVKPGMEWLVAEFDDKTTRLVVVNKTATQLLFGGARFSKFPKASRMVSEIALPALDNSLLAIKLTVGRSACHETTSLFAPLLRQYSPNLHECKFYPNIRSASLYTHSWGPYLPRLPTTSPGARLQIFLDPTCPRNEAGSDLQVDISIDVWATLGAAFLRYRMAAVAFPFSLVSLVVAKQLRSFNAGNAFMPFGTALSLFSKETLLRLLTLLSVLSLLQSFALSIHLPHVGTMLADSLAPRWISGALLGNQSPLFVPLAAFIAFACVGLVVLEYFALQGAISASASLARFVHRRGPTSLKQLMPISEPSAASLSQRVTSVGALALLVFFFAPYQFAFLVVFLIHFFTTTRTLVLAQASPATSATLWDRYHSNFSLLLVMLCLLPINALILVVWVRNLAVGWLAPFSSDHSLLSIAGSLLCVEALYEGKMLTRSSGRISSALSVLLPTAVAGYSFLYGIRYAHNIYPLANACFLWIVVSASLGFAVVDGDSVANRGDQEVKS